MSSLPPTAPAGFRAPASRGKVLVVDDSVVVRGLLSRWIREHPGFEVVGAVGDGAAAIRAAETHKPNIVILDIDMPVMDGITALPEILKVSPGSHVLVASTLTARNARLSMQCLALGAVDLQPKPEGSRDMTMSQSFRQDFMRKLEGLLHARPRNAPAAPAAPVRQFSIASAPAIRRAPGPGAPAPLRAPSRFAGAAMPAGSELPPAAAAPIPLRPLPSRLSVTPRVIVIGSSTGGPRAVTQVLEALGAAGARIPILITQHMPPIFTASFAEQIAHRTGRPAHEGVDGEIPAPGSILVAPGGKHMRLGRGADGQIHVRIDDGPPVKFCKPAVDLLFTDAAEFYGASALGVILTGMGSDGADGALLMRKAGSQIIVQDEATSVVWGMPGAAYKAGAASHVMPIDRIGPALASALQTGAIP